MKYVHDKKMIAVSLLFLLSNPVALKAKQEIKPDSINTKNEETWRYGDTISGTVESNSLANLALTQGGLVTKIIRSYGEHVKKGQILAEIDTKSLELEKKLATLERDQANLKSEYLKSKVKRLETLNAKKLIESATYEDTAFEYRLSLSAAESANLKIEVLNQKIRGSQLIAKADGIITKTYKNVGEYAEAGEALVQFMFDQERLIKFTMPDYLWDQVKIGNSVNFSALNYKVKGEAKIIQILPIIEDEKKPFFTVIAGVKASDKPLPIGTQVFFDYRK